MVELGNFYPVSGSLRGKGTAGFRTRSEAYFEVAKDAKKPFTVQFMSSSVTVLGTSFNIRAIRRETVASYSCRRIRENLKPR